MEFLLIDRLYDFVSSGDKEFIVAFDRAMKKAGYENNGIQPYFVFGKYKIEYFRPGNKTNKYVARIYFRDDGIVLRLYFSNIDKHRSYIEAAPDFLKKPFIDGSHKCKKPDCNGMPGKNGICRYQKVYKIDGVPYVSCAETSFCYYHMKAENAECYVELLCAFYPGKKR